MHRHALLAVLCVLALAIGAMGRIGHVKEPPSHEPASQARSTAAPTERAQTLLELRKQLGGSLLEGTLLLDAQSGDSTEADFLEALEQQTKNTSSGATTQQCEDRYQESLNEHLREHESADEIPHRLPQLPPRWDSARLPSLHQPLLPGELFDPELSAVLRTAGRHLDMHAADLEELGSYERSDELRHLAERIRKVAREVRGELRTCPE